MNHNGINYKKIIDYLLQVKTECKAQNLEFKTWKITNKNLIVYIGDTKALFKLTDILK